MTERQLHLMQVIGNSPGIRFREIMRQTGMKNGVLSHHLRALEKTGRIRVMRSARSTSYSTRNMSEGHLRVAGALQKSTPRAILLALAAEDGRRFSELVDCCGKSPSTVSLYLKALIKDGLVAAKKSGFAKRYHITCRSEVDRLVELYGPRSSDRPISGFEDIINSL
ncbi:MAG: ArsR family transcriptional regulator [Nitrosopumilaceae archaeon]|nr:ArsR family transcriptional regulator [Nitrosopumilaceae archaeon]